MNLTYQWAIKGLQRASSGNLEDVIVQTRWTVTGTDEDGYSGTFYGATPFDLATVDPDRFTPFAELTEEQVLGWIQSRVVDHYKDHIDEQIAKQIAAAKSPPVDVSAEALPWAVLAEA